MELFGSGGILIIVVLVLLFGAKKVPEMARSLGRAQGEFKKGLRDEKDEPEPTGGADPKRDPQD